MKKPPSSGTPRPGARGKSFGAPRKPYDGKPRPPRARGDGEARSDFRSDARPPRGEGAWRSRDGDARPPRKSFDGNPRPPRARFDGDSRSDSRADSRPPRGEGAWRSRDGDARPPRKSFDGSPRPPRARFDGDSRSDFRADSRPPRGEGAWRSRDGDARPPRKSFDGNPHPPRARFDGDSRSDFRADARPPRGEGAWRSRDGDARPPRKSFDGNPHPPRARFDGDSRSDSRSDARPPRGEGAWRGRDGDARPPRKSFDGSPRPPRGRFDGEARPRPRGDFKPRSGPRSSDGGGGAIHRANVRAVAARSISRVMRGRSLDDALAPTTQMRVAADAAMVKALAFGVLRELSILKWLAAQLLDKPLEAQDDEVAALIWVGLYQLRTLKTPPHAAINETVDAIKLLKHDYARGMINAILRRYTREAEALEERLPSEPSLRTSHPGWLVEKLYHDWPAQWEALLDANNVQAPLTLRVNRRRISREDYLARLAEMQIGAEAHPHATDAVMLEAARAVDKIPGFVGGQVSVQDASAQLAVQLLAVADGQRILDACAAPGGKTAHILEHADARVTALDVDGARLTRVDENLRRLNLSAEMIAADAAQPDRWWNGQAFDRILLDAPCSGTGVIRRHPDIKWLRRTTDIATLQQTQLGLLKALWPLLKVGGRMVYATCSLLRDEGDEVLSRFKRLADDVTMTAIDAEWGEATEYGRRIAPGGTHDGFYYAVLEKRAP